MASAPAFGWVLFCSPLGCVLTFCYVVVTGAVCTAPDWTGATQNIPIPEQAKQMLRHVFQPVGECIMS